jgi:hypothetical protein
MSSRSATLSASSYYSWIAPFPQIAFANTSIWGETFGTGNAMLASPCRNALRLPRVLPRDVRGPVLLLAFFRLV